MAPLIMKVIHSGFLVSYLTGTQCGVVVCESLQGYVINILGREVEYTDNISITLWSSVVAYI